MITKASHKQRQYDVVVWGASGFTGKLVAEYLAGRYGTNRALRWAIGGRDQSKLEALRAALAPLAAPAETLPIVVSDSLDDDAMRLMARNTRVVLSTVGPYAKYGAPLVEACAKGGTHYCDLAGEVQWMRKMIDRHQSDAEKSGAKIVHSCGFDSIPSDIGVWFLQGESRKRHGIVCNEVRLLVEAMSGGASGGTFASILNALEESRCDRGVAKILADPYALNPAGARSGPDGRDQTGVAHDHDACTWTAPFVMAAVNTRVVRRSNALLGYPYGRDFSYGEAMSTGRGAAGWLRSAAMTAGLAGFLLVCSSGVGRSFLSRRVLPQPGEGPGRRQREAGFFKLRLLGKLPDGTLVRARVAGDRDPGYGSTSRMLGESAVCLALDALPTQGGFWTPAAAMGDALLQRLITNAGLSFDLV